MLKWPNPEIVLGALLATIFWTAVLGWQSSYAPTEKQQQECYEAAKAHGLKTEDCKSFWEKTTSDPVAFFAFGTFIFTGVLGISTILLWKATGRTANIAERQLTELEAPFIEVKILDPGLDHRSPKAASGRLSFCFVNYGRTPARILEFLDEIQSVVIGEFPQPADPRSRRGRAMPFGVTAPPDGQQSEEFGAIVIRSEMSGPPAGPHNLEQRLLYFVGYVQYADIFDKVFTVGFCLLYDPMRARWAFRGDETYNYRRKEKGTYVPPPEAPSVLERT